jgi:hypothetical protein
MEEARRRAHDRLGDDIESARIVRSGKERYGGLYGFFQQQRFVIEMEMAATGTTRTPTAAADPAAADPTAADPTPASLESLLDETTDTVALGSFANDFERELELVIADATAGVATTAGGPGGSPSPRRSRAASTEPGTAPAPSGTAPSGPNHYLDTTSRRRSDTAPPLSAPPMDDRFARLLAAGVREEYLPDPDGTDLGLLLARGLAGIPLAVAPRLQAGEVVVIVGALPEASDIASRLTALSSSASAVIVATHRRVPASLRHPRAQTPEEAGALVFERRLEGCLSIVIVDVSCRAEFVAKTITGLHPAAIWGVIPASWGQAEVEELAMKTGRLDALALCGVLAAERPGSLIGEQWPIAYVDGWRASPLSVAARLLEAIGVSA